MQEISKLLRENGLKVTPQRLAIYNMLMNTDKHPSAETIYKELVVDNPSISLATVYKTLDSFKSSGLVSELNVGDNCARYDAITKSHSHIVCTCCGRVEDIKFDISDNISEEAAEKTDYKILYEQLIFYGLCPECIKKQND